MLLYRFDAALVFFNATYFRNRVLELAAAKPDLKQVVIDGSTINTIDSTGADTLDALAHDLSRQGVRLGLAGFRTETKDLLERTGVTATIGTDSVYETLEEAMTAFQADHSPPRVEPATET